VPDPVPKGERVYRGIPVSAGVCRGKLLILGRVQTGIPKLSIADDQLAGELTRLEHALVQTRHEILEVQRKVNTTVGAEEGNIFDAHLLLLEDPVLIEEATRLIQQEKVNVEFAFHAVAEKYAGALAAIEDEYLRERAADMRDVAARVLSNLQGHKHGPDLHNLPEPCIIIGHDLTPSMTAQLDKQKVLGFATDVGSQTSHTAIMARSMKIPAVVGLKDASEVLQDGEYALLDGYNGVIIINPTDQTLFEYGQIIRRQVTLEEKLREVQGMPAVTLDGHRVILSANIEQAGDAESVIAYGADGVGLFRTEYLFINQNKLPSEEEQYQAYHEVAARLKPHPVTIRTLDLGGDKFLAHLNVPHEMNPFLGWRAIRFCLQERDMFRSQLRAILRASAEGNVKMMYPMISGLDEVTQANELLAQCKAELRAENIAFDDNLEVGVMIEIPSAAVIADLLGKRAKFFSLGTNDLIQYTLAVDRLNEKIAHLYEPTHPAILRLIKTTVEAAHRHGIHASVCGEMGGDPVMTPLLLGLGVDELSAAPPLVPSIKFLIRHLKLSEARELAEFALNCESSSEILARARMLACAVAPNLLEGKV
jgi:phosphoenolpyruvate-protein phosphotransferase (PTS system enzyme I)